MDHVNDESLRRMRNNSVAFLNQVRTKRLEEDGKVSQIRKRDGERRGRGE